MYEKISDLETLTIEKATEICRGKMLQREFKLLDHIYERPEFTEPANSKGSDYFPGVDTYSSGLGSLFQAASQISNIQDLEILIDEAKRPDSFHTFVDKRGEFHELKPVYDQDRFLAIKFGLAYQENNPLQKKIDGYLNEIDNLNIQLAQEREKPALAQPPRYSGWLHNLRTAAFFAVLVPLAVGIPGYFVYQNYIKPDVRKEVEDSIPHIPTPDELIETLSEKVYPDIEKLIQKNSNFSQENLDNIIDRGIDRLAKSNPWMRPLEDQVRSKVKEKVDEKYKKKEQPEEKKQNPQSKEEEF